MSVQESKKEEFVYVHRAHVAMLHQLWQERINCIRRKIGWEELRRIEDEIGAAIHQLVMNALDPKGGW